MPSNMLWFCERSAWLVRDFQCRYNYDNKVCLIVTQ